MIVIALGANLDSQVGPPRETLKAALNSLRTEGTDITRVSGFYRTEAWPDPSDPPYQNAVAIVKTSLSSAELLALLHKIENVYGRTRSAKNAPRTLDLDLIDYDGLVQDGPPILPHPRIATRAFVLLPLAEIAPEWRHPVTGKRVSELIAALAPGEAAAVWPDSK